MNFQEYCIQCHRNTNHYYDTYLPYEFHLRMVVQVANDFTHLVYQFAEGDADSVWEDIEKACWGHDLIEDTRTSYNDIRMFSNHRVADIIYAVTNEKGKNRKERANHKYYEGICNTEGAVFVKLCDRIANVQYSKLTKSSMFEMYKSENKYFTTMLDRKEQYAHLEDMFKYLENLFA